MVRSAPKAYVPLSTARPPARASRGRQRAAQYGCDLVIDPTVRLEPYSLLARKTRLETLRAFLINETRYPNVRAVARTRTEPGNILIVGNWFYAESITPEPGAGYRQTLFTWHAPQCSHACRNSTCSLRRALRRRNYATTGCALQQPQLSGKKSGPYAEAPSNPYEVPFCPETNSP